MNRVVTIVFFSFFCLLIYAQDINLFHKLVTVGDYERAKTVLEAMRIINPGKFDTELKNINSCIMLKRDALQKYEKEHFSEALHCFELINNYYPSSVINSWIKKCQQARDEYLRKKEAEQKEKERQEEMARKKVEEESMWDRVLASDKVENYLDYLNRYPLGNHSQNAREKIFYVYSSSAYRRYLDKAYSDAVIFYEKAMTYGRLSSSEKSIYEKCKEKIMFENLMQQSISASTAENENTIRRCNQFLATYPESECSPLVRGKLVQLYCHTGNFNSARGIVKQYPQSAAFTETFTPDLSWWNKYIKQYEKQYNKKKTSKKLF